MTSFANFSDMFNDVDVQSIPLDASSGDDKPVFTTPPDGSGQHQRQKRRRVPVNCQYCRNRKLKCDRNQPCSNCIKKNGGKCEYSRAEDKPIQRKSSSRAISKAVNQAIKTVSTSPDDRPGDSSNGLALPAIGRPIYSNSSDSNARVLGEQKPASSSSSSVGAMLTAEEFSRSRQLRQLASGAGGGQNIQNRLDKMEQLIMTMLANKDNESNSQSPEDGAGTSDQDKDNEQPDAMDALGESLGMLKLDKKGNSIYHGDTHWVYLFHEMNEVHEFFKSLKVVSSEGICNMVEGIKPSEISVQNQGRSFTGREILESIPDRDICEMLVARYFEVFGPSIDVVNRPWFEQAFHDFWMAPSETEILWVALLLCMLILALKSYSPGMTPESVDGLLDQNTNIWSQGVEMCCNIGKVTFKPGLVNLRVLVLWMFAQNPFADWHEKGWANMSQVIRVAQSMGLHRDPKYFVLSPFDAEERRRIWAVIMYLDTYCSISEGLPMGINPAEEDVEEPVNIDGKDMMASFGHFPVAKDLNSVPTSSSFLIFQTRLTRLRSRAFSANLGIRQRHIPYKSLWQLDAEIRQFYNKLPKYIRQKCTDGNSKPLHYGSSLGPLELQYQRFMMECDYLKSLVVLHRVYTQRASAQPAYNASRKVTMECSLRIIDMHHWLFCTPEGAPLAERFNWPISALTLPYFMHASVVASMRLLKVKGSDVEGEKKELLTAIDKCEEVLKKVTVAAQFNEILCKLAMAMFVHTRQVASVSQKDAFQQRANMLANLEYEQTEGMRRMPPKGSTTYEFFGKYGENPEMTDKAFLLNLDTTDVNVAADTLFSPPEKGGSSTSGRTTGYSNLEDTSPESIHTSASSHKNGSGISPGVMEMPEMGGQGMAVPPLDADFGMFQMKSPAGTSNSAMENFFGEDLLRMQEVVGNEVWDNLMKNVGNGDQA